MMQVLPLKPQPATITTTQGWPGVMKIKPETAAEVNDCVDPRGMRRRITEYAHLGGEPLVRAVMNAAQARGLSGEDTMTWLAFEALKGMEAYKQMLLDQAMLAPSPLTYVVKP